jgi:DNA-binding HxlR family transcriptional regulator
MLAQTLRDLERTGLISRRSYPVVPPRVEYSLTSLGVGCAQLIAPLLRFVEANVRSFYDGQQAYTTGDAVEAGNERRAGKARVNVARDAKQRLATPSASQRSRR